MTHGKRCEGAFEVSVIMICGDFTKSIRFSFRKWVKLVWRTGSLLILRCWIVTRVCPAVCASRVKTSVDTGREPLPIKCLSPIKCGIRALSSKSTSLRCLLSSRWSEKTRTWWRIVGFGMHRRTNRVNDLSLISNGAIKRNWCESLCLES